jgi:hypothetical protein
MLQARPTEPEAATRPLRRDLVVVAVVAAVATLVFVLVLTTAGERRPVVYVSGLDDHLVEARHEVPLHASAGGAEIGRVPVDTLVRALDEQGGWLEIETAEGPRQQGWIADFYLRGQLHVVDPDEPGCPVATTHGAGEEAHHHLGPSTKVEMLDLQVGSAESWVQVRSLQTDATSWVARDSLSERPGPNPAMTPGLACGEILPEPAVAHTH